MLSLSIIFSYRFGKTVKIPSISIINPDTTCVRGTLVLTIGKFTLGIVKNNTDVLSNNVNAIIDKPRDRIIMYGLDFFWSETDPPIIIGKSGSTQGESTVSSPARNDVNNNPMISIYQIKMAKFYLSHYVH